MINILVPVKLKKEFRKFEPVLYKRIEDELYSRFWDAIVIQKAEDFSKIKGILSFGTFLINVGPEKVSNVFNLNVDDALRAVELIERIVKERQEMNKIKRAKELMMEPVMLDSKMSQAYRRFSQNSLSRLSIAIAEDGLLEEWILWPLLENHEIIDFAISSEEEVMLRIFGTKNHPPLLSREGVLVLMNCDKCSEHTSSKIARAVTLGFFSPYLTTDKKKTASRVIFHFEHERNIHPFLRQLAGLSVTMIPPLREISDSLPTILRLFISFIGQEMSNVNVDISEDVINRIKKSKWNENWREFLRFCKSFAAGEEKLQRDLNSYKSIPKLRDYVKSIEAEAEKELIKRAIELHGMNRVRLSKALGINPKTLTKKLKIYGLDDKN